MDVSVDKLETASAVLKADKEKHAEVKAGKKKLVQAEAELKARKPPPKRPKPAQAKVEEPLKRAPESKKAAAIRTGWNKSQLAQRIKILGADLMVGVAENRSAKWLIEKLDELDGLSAEIREIIGH